VNPKLLTVAAAAAAAQQQFVLTTVNSEIGARLNPGEMAHY